MDKKRHYEPPALEVVELALQRCLLAGSGTDSTLGTGSPLEDVNTDNVPDWWQ